MVRFSPRTVAVPVVTPRGLKVPVAATGRMATAKMQSAPWYRFTMMSMGALVGLELVAVAPLASDWVLSTGASMVIWALTAATAALAVGVSSRPLSSSAGVKMWQKYMIPIEPWMIDIQTSVVMSCAVGVPCPASMVVVSMSFQTGFFVVDPAAQVVDPLCDIPKVAGRGGIVAVRSFFVHG